MALNIRIAMLNADKPVPIVAAKFGSYGDIFHNLLTAAAKRISPNVTIEAQDFDVVHGEYPKSASDFDALLVTGSAASSYDDQEWIHKLDAYLLEVYEQHPQVRLFGSCFGHQILCQSLLRKHGVIVEKDPNGWELGVQELRINDTFHQALRLPKTLPQIDGPPTIESLNESDTQSSRSLRLQFVHADHVKIPQDQSLPPNWMVIGSTKHCAVQGVYEPRRILTYQGHFEFDRFVNTETVKIFGAKWEDQTLKNALEAMDEDDDAIEAAEIVVRFLMEGR